MLGFVDGWVTDSSFDSLKFHGGKPAGFQGGSCFKEPYVKFWQKGLDPETRVST